MYRLITLTSDGVVKGERVGGTGVALLCKECLVRECDLELLGDPVFYGDVPGVPGPPEIAAMILPLRLTKSQVAALREEICEETPLEKPV